MNKKLLKSTGSVAAMTLLSRIFGFARDIMFASVFGAGGGFDAFVIAFKIPNFLRRLFGEGAFAQAFVPVLSEYREKRSAQETQQFINHIASNLATALVLVVLAAELLAPLLVMLFAPGFIHHAEQFAVTEHLLRITFPYLLLIGLTAFMGASLNTYGYFTLPAFTPVLLNIALIVVAYFWAPHTAQPIVTLGWGVIIGGLVQLAIQFPAFKRAGLHLRFSINWKDPGVRRVLRLMVPALFGVSVAQISLLIDNVFASYLPEGSISWLYYSDRLTYLPLGVIGVALATVVLPKLSRHHSAKEKTHYKATLDWALRCALLIGLPAALGLLLLAGPLLVALIYHGAFNQLDVLKTRQSLMAFSLGLPAFMLVKILASAFYSKQNIKTPVKIAAFAMLCNLVLNLILIRPLAHAGLALATAASGWVNAGLLWIMLHRQNVYQAAKGWWVFVLRIVLACAAMVVFLWFMRGQLTQWFLWHEAYRVMHLLLLIVVAIVLYITMLWVTGMRLSHLRAPE